MPRVVSKGSITGRAAFNNGGLGLSIGTRVGGARHAIARRAPDSIKIGNDGGLSFVVLGIYYSVDLQYTFQFNTVQQVSFGQRYSVFNNKDSVFMIYGVPDGSLYGFGIAVSSFATNVTSNSFEITFPIISGIDDLVLDNMVSSDLVYQRSGSSGPLSLIETDLETDIDFFKSSQFTVNFKVIENPQLDDVKNELRFYSGKTFKYQLNSNDSGVVIYDGVSHPFNLRNSDFDE